MLNRIPRLIADSPWEAKAIAVIRSIGSQQASHPVSYDESLHLLHVTLFLHHKVFLNLFLCMLCHTVNWEIFIHKISRGILWKVFNNIIHWGKCFVGLIFIASHKYKISELTAEKFWFWYILDQVYIEGCIELLQGIRTHWSEAVEQMVRDCLSVKHPWLVSIST